MAVLGLNAIDQMFFIPAYPFWSLTIIAVDVVALCGLCAYGSRANLQAPDTAARRRCATSGRGSRYGPLSERRVSRSCVGSFRTI